MKTNRAFELAKNISTMSDFHKQKIGCVFIYRGRVIASEHNTGKTNPIQKEYNKLRNFEVHHCNNGAIHAEMGCLLKTKHMEVDWSKVSVFVYREKKDGTIASSKPCPACRQALKDRGIKRIYYTIEDGYCFEKIN